MAITHFLFTALCLSMATLTVSQAPPFIAADGDDIQLGVKGMTYSLADIISRLEALEGVVLRESVLEGQATDTIRLGRMSFDDTIRVTGSISNCDSDVAKGFGLMIVGNPGTSTVEVFVTTPGANFGDGSGNQIFVKSAGSGVELFLAIGGFQSDGACGNGDYVVRAVSNTGSLQSDTVATFDGATAISPLVVSEDSATQFMVSSLANTLTQTLTDHATQIETQEQTLTTLGTSTTSLQETQAGLVQDLEVVVTNVNYLAANVSAINNCSLDGQVHNGNGQCMSAVPTCITFGTISNGAMVHAVSSSTKYSSILGATVKALCDDGYYSSGESHSTCKIDGWSFPASKFSCARCNADLKCTTCSTATTCTSCQNGYNLNMATGTCDPSCANAAVGKTNLLLYRPATTTSSCYGPRLQPKYLTDGVAPTLKSSQYWHSCVGDNTPAATVLLGVATCVKQVKVWPRCDCSCGGGRTNGVYAEIMRASDSKWIRCTYKSKPTIFGLNSNPQDFCQAAGYTLDCPAVVGTLVRVIKQNGGGTINIGEFQAFGAAE